jgi:hypothetical protein
MTPSGTSNDGNTSPTASSRMAAGTASLAAGLASGKHQGLRQPADDERVEDAVDNIGLSDRGESMEDHLRDRRSKGVRNGFDDSIDHDAGDVSSAVDRVPPRT